MNLPFFNKRTILILSVLFLILPGCQSDQTTGGGGSSGGTPTDQIVVINPNLPPLSKVYPVSPVSLPMPLFQSSSVIYSDPVAGSFLFVLGGAYFDAASPTPNDPINVDTVYWTKINSDGTLAPFCSVQATGSCQLLSLLPINTRGHSSVLNGTDIYVIGGIQSGCGQFCGGFTDAIYKSTITIHKDTNSSPYYPTLLPWSQVGNLPVAETGMASVTIGNNFFVIGGIESGILQQTQTTQYSNKIYGYGLPLFLTSTANTYSYVIPNSKGIFTPAAATDNVSSLWVLGGWGPDPTLPNNPPNNLNQIYQFTASSSTIISGKVVGTLPMGLSKAAAFYIPPFSGSGQIILIGGVSGNQGTPDVIHQEIYSIDTISFGSTVIGKIPQAITCFASSMDPASGIIYVIGGINGVDPSCISN